MDAQKFLAEFSHVANAPGGIAQLRKMIYQLAVTGSLTSQGEDSEDAGQLLLRITQERQRLIRSKKYKRIVLLESEPIQQPQGIEIPKNWKWSRLLDIGEINPRNDVSDDCQASFVPMSGIPQLHKAPVVAEPKKWAEIKKGYTHFANGDVVLAKITPCFENGKSAVIQNLPGDGVGAGTTELQIIRLIHKGVLPDYVYIYLRSPLFMIEGEKNMTGTAGQKRVPTDYFATRAFPLPPTEEQSRIVAKVDELMALCDRLEAQQQERRTLQNALRQSTLQALASAQSPHELQESWERLQNNFGRLFGEPMDVADLRLLVLNLAISGLLSERKSGDEMVEKFVARNREEKEKRLASGEMKRKSASATDVIQLAVEAPAHWEMLSLEDIFQFIDYRGKTPTKTSDGVVLITAKNVRPGVINQDPVEYISNAAYLNWMTRGFPRAGDLLFTTEAPLGNVAVIETTPVFALAQRIIDLQPFADINTRCIMYFMMSPVFQDLLDKNSTGMTAKGIKAGKLKQLKIPVPPIPEQARIVSRIKEIMKICDKLERQLSDSRKMAAHIAEAVLAAVGGISTEQEAPAELTT